ncbi:MAG: formylglycine-generating enzyme family protein [Myxococcota bacterium]|jgi:formylglycine-generating enzyme required for sulfatase activity|nr:SUMF1/EgtB/PvdO family nonheme iron enzyme [Myxococcota bacterium]MBP8971725.1 SUMF1/EgtB/PvdO family nonheme iron enzyme [Myxococcota bacterium]OQC41213.1 MAG: Serine/threonine-protein kinase pkn1 [Deltaproteobacteria bacterium ADurb.Bin058]HHW95690.1 formylglycine-generating enzyme family protein [Oligoflexales bacterium]
MNRLWISIVTVLLAVSCVTGVTPPEPTKMVKIKGGLFLFGDEAPCYNANETPKSCKDAFGMPSTYPAVKVDVAPFLIEQHEVTNLQYRHCVELGGCREPKYFNTLGIEDYYGNPLYDDFPVVNVTLDMAREYCNFHGRRLPTEVEWERAAVGQATTAERKRPWPISDPNIDINKCDREAYRVSLMFCTGISSPAKVMSSIDDLIVENGEHIYDMTGNVSEWVEGYFKADMTCKESLPDECVCLKCATPNCKETCYTTCSECEENDNCFGVCASEYSPKGLPVCIAYSEVVDARELVPERGNERLLKGGNCQVTKQQTCRARATDRFFHVHLEASNPVYGFRCADYSDDI